MALFVTTPPPPLPPRPADAVIDAVLRGLAAGGIYGRLDEDMSAEGLALPLGDETESEIAAALTHLARDRRVCATYGGWALTPAEWARRIEEVAARRLELNASGLRPTLSFQTDMERLLAGTESEPAPTVTPPSSTLRTGEAPTEA